MLRGKVGGISVIRSMIFRRSIFSFFLFILYSTTVVVLFSQCASTRRNSRFPSSPVSFLPSFPGDDQDGRSWWISAIAAHEFERAVSSGRTFVAEGNSCRQKRAKTFHGLSFFFFLIFIPTCHFFFLFLDLDSDPKRKGAVKIFLNRSNDKMFTFLRYAQNLYQNSTEKKEREKM